MRGRFTYTTDPEIGPPGFYRHDDDTGELDATVAYKWVDEAPEDPENGAGHFAPSEHQWRRAPSPTAAQLPSPPEPERVVPLEAVAHAVAETAIAPEKPKRRLRYTLRRHR